MCLLGSSLGLSTSFKPSGFGNASINLIFINHTFILLKRPGERGSEALIKNPNHGLILALSQPITYANSLGVDNTNHIHGRF